MSGPSVPQPPSPTRRGSAVAKGVDAWAMAQPCCRRPQQQGAGRQVGGWRGINHPILPHLHRLQATLQDPLGLLSAVQALPDIPRLHSRRVGPRLCFVRLGLPCRALLGGVPQGCLEICVTRRDADCMGRALITLDMQGHVATICAAKASSGLALSLLPLSPSLGQRCHLPSAPGPRRARPPGATPASPSQTFARPPSQPPGSRV